MIEYSLLFAAIASLLVLVFFALGSYVTGALSTPCGPTASVTQTSTACPVR